MAELPKPSEEDLERVFDNHSSYYGYDGRALDWEDFKAAVHELFAFYEINS